MQFNIFSCYKCKHAIIKNSKQVGCEENKLEKLISDDKAQILDDDYFYSLEKVCLFKDDNNTANKSEVDIRLGYIFILNDANKLDILKNNINLIKDKNPIWIGVTHQFEDLNSDIVNILEAANCKYNIIINYKESDDVFKPDQYMNQYLNGWTLINIVGEPFNSNAKEILQDCIINKDLVAAAIVDTCDDSKINNVCFFNILYKYLNGSKLELKDSEDDSGEITGYVKSYIRKVLETKSSMIKTWKELT